MTNEIDETLPDIVKDFLRSGGELESIRLNERGEWKHEGLDFENRRIIDLFNRSVSRTEGGTWVLEIGRFTYPIEVDRTGYFVESIDFGEPISISLSDATQEPLDVASIYYEDPGKLFCEIKQGAFEARFKKPAYYAIAEHVVEEDDKLVLELEGHEKVTLADVT